MGKNHDYAIHKRENENRPYVWDPVSIYHNVRKYKLKHEWYALFFLSGWQTFF